MAVYEFKLYDETLLKFNLAETDFGYSCSIIQAGNSLHLLPVELAGISGKALLGKTLLDWLGGRVIPKNRAHVEVILKSFGLAVDDLKGIIDVGKGLSLNDSFWIVPDGFKGKFENYNLYDNRFSEILSLVAYTGAPLKDKEFTTSPEFTTGGMLKKAWRFIPGDGIFLFKGGTSGAANTGREPYCEFYAGQIAQAMGLKAVYYDLEQWKDILGSKCKLFTDVDTAFVAVGRLMKTDDIREAVEIYDGFGGNFSNFVRDMLVFDSLIYNEDRHFGNFGFLRDNRSGNFVSPAPIFDNGYSLFNYAMPDDYKNLDEYARTRKSVYSIAHKRVTFEVLCRNFATPRQVEQLHKILNFSFKRHSKYNLEYLSLIEKHLQKRAAFLIGLISQKQEKINIDVFEEKSDAAAKDGKENEFNNIFEELAYYVTNDIKQAVLFFVEKDLDPRKEALNDYGLLDFEVEIFQEELKKMAGNPEYYGIAEEVLIVWGERHKIGRVQTNTKKDEFDSQIIYDDF